VAETRRAHNTSDTLHIIVIAHRANSRHSAGLRLTVLTILIALNWQIPGTCSYFSVFDNNVFRTIGRRTTFDILGGWLT